MLTKEEIVELISIFDDYYVRTSTCQDIQTENLKKFDDGTTHIKLIEQKLESWGWIFKLIATGTIGTMVTSLISLVLK